MTNFNNTLPEVDSDLAQELTRDPYNFSFTGLRGKYNERILKDTLLTNITNFLLELGTGFAYVGKVDKSAELSVHAIIFFARRVATIQQLDYLFANRKITLWHNMLWNQVTNL